MGAGESAWERAREARERLDAWLRSRELDAALGALEDISTLRRALDQAELTAVAAARGAGRSWAEIATMLGITRQSAWERWRDLEPEPPQAGALSRAAAAMRRQPQVMVPNVIGRLWDDAFTILHLAELVAVGPDPDAGLQVDRADYVVTDQSAESGARVPPGTSVTLWTERRGGSGVREPRRPRVPPTAGRQLRDEQTNEAVG
jgi:hypothetical protein